MIRLSAFGDEIAPDLDQQLAGFKNEGIRYLDLRSAWNTNVLDLSDEQVAEIKRRLDEAGIRVAAIGSPVGKVPIQTPLDEEMARLDRAIFLAGAFGTPYIRIFSFYPPSGAPIGEWRDEVLRRLRAMADRASEAGVILLHENDTGLYGDTIERCVDVMEQVGGPHFGAVLDPQNFVNSGERSYPDGYEAMRPWIRYVHVKDTVPGQGMVPAGEGAAGWLEILQRLRADGYDGFLSLEPHLAAGGPYGGFSGQQLFHRAAQALRELLQAMDWEYS